MLILTYVTQILEELLIAPEGIEIWVNCIIIKRISHTLNRTRRN